MKLTTLSKTQLRRVFHKKVAKYVSQHDPYRFYLIDYKTDDCFYTHTYENGKLLGSGQGEYELFDLGISGAVMEVKYNNIVSSPNPESPMHPDNSFYPKLKKYLVGPFYTQALDLNSKWQPILYQHLQKEKAFKVLNFYDRDLFDNRSL
uniref:Uncharacterized protein n=1 Tax=viral metagenome TaxID=1070528 RepID=A0A6C0CQS5_9ZZZZ